VIDPTRFGIVGDPTTPADRRRPENTPHREQIRVPKRRFQHSLHGQAKKQREIKALTIEHP
jgi:hypothetical protein